MRHFLLEGFVWEEAVRVTILWREDSVDWDLSVDRRFAFGVKFPNSDPAKIAPTTRSLLVQRPTSATPPPQTGVQKNLRSRSCRRLWSRSGVETRGGWISCERRADEKWHVNLHVGSVQATNFPNNWNRESLFENWEVESKWNPFYIYRLASVLCNFPIHWY